MTGTRHVDPAGHVAAGRVRAPDRARRRGRGRPSRPNPSAIAGRGDAAHRRAARRAAVAARTDGDRRDRQRVAVRGRVRSCIRTVVNDGDGGVLARDDQRRRRPDGPHRPLIVTRRRSPSTSVGVRCVASGRPRHRPRGAGDPVHRHRCRRAGGRRACRWCSATCSRACSGLDVDIGGGAFSAPVLGSFLASFGFGAALIHYTTNADADVGGARWASSAASSSAGSRWP